MTQPHDLQLLLHMGHPKTGSTSLQHALSAARARLKKQGILYPNSMQLAYNHRAYFVDILQRSQSNLVLTMGGHAESKKIGTKEWQQLGEALERGQFSTLIMSAEGLLGNVIRADQETLRKRLSSVTDKQVRALAYVREPSSYFLSQLQQRIKGGRGLEAPKPLQWSRSIAFCRQDLNFDLQVRAYERRQLVNGDSIADFYDWAKLDPAGHAKSSLQANVSLSSEAMAVVYKLGLKSWPKSQAELSRQRALAQIAKRFDADLGDPTKPVLRDNWREHITYINTDFLVLRDEVGLHFSDLAYDRIGVGPAITAPRFKQVEDVCPYDQARYQELMALVKAEFSQLKTGKRPWWKRALPSLQP